MLYAINNQLPPKEWYHDPKIKNAMGCSVKQILLAHGLTYPEEWDY